MAASPEIERLIGLLAKLPGLGPRSARRAALTLLKRKEQLLDPLAHAMADASQKVVAQAEEAVRLANARYNAGTSAQLDVLQSQVDLTTARTNQIQAYYSYNVAVATLRKATGQADEFVTN